VQPGVGLQGSSVQRSASLQLGGVPPTQAPPPQVSPVVQALPSSQGAELLVFVHPVAGLQKSFVQRFPSLHAAEFPVCTHPTAGLQESTVHAMPSSQFEGGPPTQMLPLQVPPVVQTLSSSHAPE